MKRCLLVCSLVLVFALLLSACASDEAAFAPTAESPALDMAFSVADDAPEPAPEAEPMITPEPLPEVAEEAFDVWEDDALDDVAMDSIDMVMEEWEYISSDVEIAFPFTTPGRATSDDYPTYGIHDYTEDDPAPIPIITPDDPRGRRLTYTVHTDLQTTNFSTATNLIAITAAEQGGFVLHSSMHGGDIRDTDTERFAFYEIRLPTENLPEFLVVIRQNFYVVNLSQSSEDITVDYELTEWEIEDLTELEEWLEEALEDDDLEVSERRDLEAYLAEVRSDIRNAQQRHSAMEYDILYSSVHIWIQEVIIEDEEDEDDNDYYVNGEDDEVTFGDRFGQAAATSFGGFVGFLQGLLIVIVTILPTLFVLAIITFAIIFSVRKYKKWRKANPKQEKVLPPNNANNQMNSNAYWNYNNNPNNTYNNIQNPPSVPLSTSAPENKNENNIE